MKNFGFGLMRLPLMNPEDQTSIDIEKVKEMADEFMNQGFTYFDTASCYHQGHSEIAFREAVVKRYPRESYTITDKLSLFMLKKGDTLEEFFAKQFEKLEVDYLDYYLVHSLDKEGYKAAKEWKAFEFVAQKKAEGKVKHIGFSFHGDAPLLEEILNDHPEVEYVQLQINYLDWEDANIQSRRCYEIAEKYGKPVIVMEPVKGGVLANVPEEAKDLLKAKDADKSEASWAIRFAASQKNVVMVLSGMSNMEQTKDNLSYMKDFKALSDEEQEMLQEVVRIIHKDQTIACTGCRYCEEDCPKKIAIPDVFSIYNDYKRFHQKNAADTYYGNLIENHGKASDCIACGKCEKICPQHLPIREYLKDIAKELEE